MKERETDESGRLERERETSNESARESGRLESQRQREQGGA